jgi:hypothetical protein
MMKELKDSYYSQNALAIKRSAPTDDEEEEQEVTPSPTSHPAYKTSHTPVGVWPLWDHVNLKSESQILSHIVQYLHPDMRDSGTGYLVSFIPIFIHPHH